MTYPLAIASLALLAATLPATASEPDARAVFAAHDPNGRLPDTQIEQLGAVRVGEVTDSIYYLTFVNPLSRRGQQRIATVRNGGQFAGSYQCWLGEGGPRLVIGEDRLTVHVDDLEFEIRFDENSPSRNAFFCGEGSGWENGI